MTRRTWIAAAMATTLGVASAAAPAALAQSSYPERPIRLIVGFPPGSSADIGARVLSNHVSKTLGQQLIVETRPGAGSSIAAEQVARADNDGYTLYMLSSANITNELTNPALPFKIAKDFEPIALLIGFAMVLAVHPSTGVDNVKDLIALAKSKPGRLDYASTGVSTVSHLFGALFAQRAGIDIQHVPYKGSPPAVNDLLGGRVAMMFSPASAVVPHGKEGKLRMLATATAKRIGILPDTPTMAETGMPGFDGSSWFGIGAPAGTPRPIIDRLAKAIAEVSAAPEAAKIWEPQGIFPLSGGPEELAKHIADEFDRWGPVVEAAGLTKKK